MRKLLLILCNVVLFLNMFSQPTLYKEWYNSDNYLKITPKKSTINSFYYFDKTIIQNQGESTLLTFINYYWKAGSLKRYKDICQFNVIKNSNDTLILSAVNEKSKKYLRNQDSVFTSQIWVGNPNPDFYFQNLIVITSHFFLSEIYEIDSVGNITYTKKGFDNIKESYSGKLKYEELNKLVDLLSRYDFSKYDHAPIRMDIDAPYLFIEIKHNNTVSKMESMCYLSKEDKINVLRDFVLHLKS